MYCKSLLILTVLYLLELVHTVDPVPPTTWPPSWHTTVVTTIVDRSKPGNPPIFNKKQRIAFDVGDQYTCRYEQQDLINPSTPISVDMCDYITGYHWGLQSSSQLTNCTQSTNLSGTLKPIVWPQPFLDAAKFMGNNTISNEVCNHFLAMNIILDGKQQQLDVWTSVDRGFPCLIVLQTVSSTIIYTWAFSDFSDFIPPEAAQCTAPKLICTEGDWICRSKRGLTIDELGAALQIVCEQIDCDPINPDGAHFIPNTVQAHCDWAFNTYFQKFKASYGILACDFNGAGELVPKNQTRTIFSKHAFKNQPPPLRSIVSSVDLVCADTPNFKFLP